MQLNRIVTAALFASALMITLSACQEDGPMENAGEEMDDSVENAGDAIENATDRN